MRKYAMLACISALLSAALVSSQAPTVTPYPYVVIVKPNDMVTICDGEGCPYDNTLPDQTIYVAPDGCIDSDSMKQPISLNIPSLQTQAIPVQGDYVTCTPSGCIEGDQNVIFTISNAYVTRSHIL